MEIRGQLHPPGEVAGALQADPEGLGAWGTVAFAPQMAAEAGDPTEHGRQRWRGGRRGLPMNRDVNGPPFGRIQDGIAGRLGGCPPQHRQVLNPPSDDQVQGQGGFQTVQGAELQGFYPATGFENSEKDLNTPSTTLPLDQLSRRDQGVGQAV